MLSEGIIILGGGGHAKVVAEALRAAGALVLGFTDPRPDPSRRLSEAHDAPRLLGTDEVVAEYDATAIRLALGVGSVRPSTARATLFENFRARGYRFVTVIHPSAVVANDVELGEGCQIMAGAVIQPACRIGDGALINTRASLDHDSTVGRFVHIAPGATLSGGVTLGDGCHIGVGAVVAQNISVGIDAFVTAGSVVTFNVPEGGRMSPIAAKGRVV